MQCDDDARKTLNYQRVVFSLYWTFRPNVDNSLRILVTDKTRTNQRLMTLISFCFSSISLKMSCVFPLLNLVAIKARNGNNSVL